MINPSNSFSRVVEPIAIAWSTDNEFTIVSDEKIKTAVAVSTTIVEQASRSSNVSLNFESLLFCQCRWSVQRALRSYFLFHSQHMEKMACEEKTIEKIELKRELGLFSAVSIILAVMIGKIRLLTMKIYKFSTDTDKS